MELSLAKPQILRKPLMLKDYLLDDLSSCSSSGFGSFPRRQCCTSAVGFLLEIDLNKKQPVPKYVNQRPNLKYPLKKPSQSAFRRAINAVKSLPFATVKSSSSKLTLLPRSLSRKLLKRSFWNRKEIIPRLEPIDQITLRNVSQPSDSTTAGGDQHRSSTSESDSKSNSWSDSDFTASDDSTSGNSEVKISNEIQHGVVFLEKRLPKDEVVSSKRIGVIVGGGDDSIHATTSSDDSSTGTHTSIRKWPSEEEKEQFSPVSVLDCPFADDDDDDDQDEVSSPFQNRLARMEGSKRRLMKKIKRFERLTQLEPLNLQSRIALSSESDQESNDSPQFLSSDFKLDRSSKLLQLAKATIPSISQESKAEHDKLLLDLFKEGVELEDSRSVRLDDHELINIAKRWISGQPSELFLGWEVQKNRESYIRDMERGGTWRKTNEEKQEMALELEAEVFAYLMNELLNDLL